MENAPIGARGRQKQGIAIIENSSNRQNRIDEEAMRRKRE